MYWFMLVILADSQVHTIKKNLEKKKQNNPLIHTIPILIGPKQTILSMALFVTKGIWAILEKAREALLLDTMNHWKQCN